MDRRIAEHEREVGEMRRREGQALLRERLKPAGRDVGRRHGGEPESARSVSWFSSAMLVPGSWHSMRSRRCSPSWVRSGRSSACCGALEPALGRLGALAALARQHQQRAERALRIRRQRRELRHYGDAPIILLRLEQRDGVRAAPDPGARAAPRRRCAACGPVRCSRRLAASSRPSRCSSARRKSGLTPRAATWRSSAPRTAWFGE